MWRVFETVPVPYRTGPPRAMILTTTARPAVFAIDVMEMLRDEPLIPTMAQASDTQHGEWFINNLPPNVGLLDEVVLLDELGVEKVGVTEKPPIVVGRLVPNVERSKVDATNDTVGGGGGGRGLGFDPPPPELPIPLQVLLPGVQEVPLAQPSIRVSPRFWLL